MRVDDELTLYSGDSEILEPGIKALKGLTFRPSLLSFAQYSFGHGQTFMTEIKEQVFKKLWGGDFNYDERYLLTL